MTTTDWAKLKNQLKKSCKSQRNFSSARFVVKPAEISLLNQFISFKKNKEETEEQSAKMRVKSTHLTRMTILRMSGKKRKPEMKQRSETHTHTATAKSRNRTREVFND